MKAYKFEIFTSVIQENIRVGLYKPGFKLPAVRQIKEIYKLSTSTVQQGYDDLVARGLIESIPRSGYYVLDSQVKVHKGIKKERPVVRDAVFEDRLSLTTSSYTGSRVNEFNVAAPGDLLIPQKLILRTMQQVIRESGLGLLKYYPAAGSSLLRQSLAERAAANHTILNPEELLITDGALQALYIALSAVCSPGDVIAVESPCVFSALEVIRVLRLKVIEIPVDPIYGFDLDFLRKACLVNDIKAVMVTPNFHNPTGTQLTDVQKKTMLSIALENGFAVIENDVYGDLNYSGPRPTTIKSFDQSGIVMTYSSFSKTLAPGIRLGWLSAGKFLGRAEQIRFALGSTVSPIYQETVYKLISTSSFDRHIRKFRNYLAKNAHQTLTLLSDFFPEGTHMTRPAGGYHGWVRLPDSVPVDKFYLACATSGVKFTPGYTFSFSGQYQQYFRIVFADRYTQERKDAIARAGISAVRLA